MKKEVSIAVLIILVSILTLLTFIMISGCSKDELIICNPPLKVINNTCCMDINNDTICDKGTIVENAEIPENITGCGNGICETSAAEDCSNCWQDCGACKKIVYVYVARNFTLGELTENLNNIPGMQVKFKKDINALNDVSNFFVSKKLKSIYIADFMDTIYHPPRNARDMILSNIINNNYFVNDSDSLINYLNFTNWYLVHRPKATRVQEYEKRIMEGLATEDYPTQPTGYQKEQKYNEWKFRNYTKEEVVFYDHVKVLNRTDEDDSGIVESLYASITKYVLTYKTSEYKKNDEPDFVLENFDYVEELLLSNIHTASIQCGNNLVITIYNFDYDPAYFGINEENLEEQIRINRAALLKKIIPIKKMCDREFEGEVFTYT